MDSQLCVGVFIGIIIVVVVLALMRGRSGSGGGSSTAAPSGPASGKFKKGMSKTAEPTKVPFPAEKTGDKHEAKSKAVAVEERKSKGKDSGLHKKRVEPELHKTLGVKRNDDEKPDKTSKGGGISKSRVDDEPRKKGKLTKGGPEDSDSGSRGVMK